ncbi:glycosyltransferase, partial [Methanosarcina sp. 2.H.T.1A.15]|uniref:glycosyltransferase family protein n=1 Tax=Methanosarcina sp. 2.H.T.1A.15 TaxID=1483596 RepID=UPI000AA14848
KTAYEIASCLVGSEMCIRDSLKASEGGIPVPPENPEALADAISKLLDNRELRAKLGSKGLSHVTENYSWYSVAKQVDGVCKSGLKG